MLFVCGTKQYFICDPGHNGFPPFVSRTRQNIIFDNGELWIVAHCVWNHTTFPLTAMQRSNDNQLLLEPDGSRSYSSWIWSPCGRTLQSLCMHRIISKILSEKPGFQSPHGFGQWARSMYKLLRAWRSVGCQ